MTTSQRKTKAEQTIRNTYSTQHNICVLYLRECCKYSVTNVLMNLTQNACNLKHIYAQHGCFMSKEKVRKFGNQWHVQTISPGILFLKVEAYL